MIGPGSVGRFIMRNIVIGLAAASLLVAGPASARNRHWHHHDNVDAGDVVAGVAVVGCLAALFSAIGSNYAQKPYADVEACTREAESRTGGRVAGIGQVEKSKGYYTVSGSVDMDGSRGPAFSCTIRNGTIYGFRMAEDEA
jgi:hypothetical protein